MLKEINGSLLNSSEEFLCHQCNCIANSAGGLAALIFSVHPQSDTYKFRKVPNTPGTISVHKIENNRSVVNMYSQYYPGYPNAADSVSNRIEYFQHCLEEIKALTPKSVAFPARIGCGLAGGDWNTYLSMIRDFHDQFVVDVTIYDIGY